MPQPMKMLAIFLCLAFPVMLFCSTSIATGKASVTMSGYAIDSSGNLYIGKEYEIQVYDSGILKYTINPQTSRAYVFTMDSNDRIILSTASTVYTMSLQGDVLSEIEDYGTSTYNKLASRKRFFTAANGDKYTLVSILGRFVILRNNREIIYKMPVLDYVVKMLWWLVYLSSLVIVPIILVKWRRWDRKSSAFQK